MALKIYGQPKSRAVRVIWMAEELGIPYENVPVTMADKAHKQPAYTSINPNARLPAIDDDGFRMSESLAINYYLAKKHGKFLGTIVSTPEEAKKFMAQGFLFFQAVAELNLMAVGAEHAVAVEIVE